MLVLQARDIVAAVASIMSGYSKGEFYELTMRDLLGPCRVRRIAYPRMFACYLIRKHFNYSLPKIGMIFSQRDHTTILHAIRVMTKKYGDDPKWGVLETKILALAQIRADERRVALEERRSHLQLVIDNKEIGDKVPQPTVGGTHVIAGA